MKLFFSLEVAKLIEYFIANLIIFDNMYTFVILQLHKVINTHVFFMIVNDNIIIKQIVIIVIDFYNLLVRNNV